MDGDGYADYVMVESSGQVKWARNTHNNGKDPDKRNWETAKTIAPGPQGIPSDRARLYDLDGDKKSDYVIVYAGGAVRAFRNLHGDGEDRTWGDLGTIAPGVSGVTGDMIRFADTDGDGLADFLAVDSDGSIKMWKNTGTGFSAKGVTFRLADLTGDGKADIIAVDSKGRAQAWLNKGLGNAWESIGEIAPGLNEDLSSSRIEFVDVNGDGLADYLVIYGGGAVKAYLNNSNIPDAGKSRTWQPGLTIAPGVGEPGHKIQFADLNGDGYADYIVVFDGGAADVYLNQKNIPPNGGRIWADKETVSGGVGASGNKIVFADINGNGLAEYIVQYDGGASKGYNNTGNIPDAGKSRNWEYMGTIAAGVSPQGPVVYADIDGDGKADYLVVFDTGRINAYINSCDWRPIPSSGNDNGGNDNGGDGGDGNGGGVGNSGDDDGDDGGVGGPTRTNTAPWPIVTGRGHCDGPDCEDGKCTGVLCGSFDCEGDDCYNGYCIGRDCTAIGCIGPGCKNGHVEQTASASDRVALSPYVSVSTAPMACALGQDAILLAARGVVVPTLLCKPPPAPSQPEGCETTTFEACNTRCTYYSTTTKCSTDCNDIEACTRPTDSSTATTKTCPIPVVTNDWVEDDPDGPAPTLGDGGLNGEWNSGKPNVSQGTRPTQTKTSAPASPTKTKAPMKRNQPVCNDESDFPGHADIRAESVESLAFDFCDIASLYQAIGPGQEIKETLSDKYGIKFRYSIKWIEGCITTVDKQEVIYPLTEDDRDWPWGSECWVIFRDSWELCNNGGVAGYSDAACLRYQLDAGIWHASLPLLCSLIITLS
ncbi:hypothetical protein EDB80DRAFT_692629 [Ilyonectria destructans]|nr:hypothetical protein EDB80DRAFT_693713 [Ilyonectria destructans]KAH6976564.1 hypothetical protein EDB80DRAFT_692629 [Ilyonectria destructans]